MKYLSFILMLLICQQLSAQKAYSFEGTAVPAGTKMHFSISVTEGNDSTTIPVTVFHGALAGPTVGITAGVHGFEYPPIMAAQKLIASIDPQNLCGVVILVQVANLESFRLRAPFVNPIDGKNLNRSFPGKEKGSITEKVAHFITENVIARADYFVDMHGGDAPEDLMPYAAYYQNNAMERASATGKKMAIALGFDHVVVFDTDGKDYLKKEFPSLYCSAEAFKRGIPSVDIECGSLGKADPLLITTIETGVLKLLGSLGMLPSAPEATPNDVLLITDRAYISSAYDGIFYPSKVAGEYVSKGMKLGYVTNYFGETLETIKASEDGILLIILGTPPVNKGETLAVIGKVTD